MQGLLNLLAPEATLASDGGGKVLAARNVLHGASNVARFLLGVIGKVPPDTRVDIRVAEVNSQPGVLAYLDGRLNVVFVLEAQGEHIRRVNVVVNPDKLGAMPPTQET